MRKCIVLVAALVSVYSLSPEVCGEEVRPVSFRSDIAPILLDHCLACHGAKKAEGGYRVDSYQELLKAGDSGELPIATSGDQVSELLRRVTCDDPSERMPTESEPLTGDQIEFLQRWIAAGASFDGDDPGKLLSLVIPPVQYADPPPTYAQAVPITATLFTPDAAQLVTGGYHELMIWNAADGLLVRRIKNVGQRVFALAFSPDGKTLAVGGGEPGRSGEVRLIDFASGEIKGVVARSADVILDLAYRPGTDELAIATADSTIRMVNAESLADLRTIASHADWVTAIAWSDDGTRLASASRDQSAKVYDGATGELISSYIGHGAAVRGISILADNRQVVTVGSDGKMHRWDSEGAAKVAELSIGGEGFKLIRNGNHIFVPCSDKRLLMIDSSNNTISQQYSGHNDWVLTVCRQPSATNDGWVASGSIDGEVRLWNPTDATLVRHWIAKP